MPVEIKTIKVELSSAPMTERRFSQYPTFKIDGVVASTKTDNALPTIARMNEIVEGLFFYERMCVFLSAYGVTVKMLTDTSNLANAVPASVQLELSYNPLRLPIDDAVMGVSRPEVAVGSTMINATRPELIAIGNIIWEAVREPTDIAARAKWNGPAIECVQQGANGTANFVADNNVGLPYNVIQLTTKQHEAITYVSAMRIKEA